ncbi:hypothetical protein HMPREF3045_07690 [Anaerococcus sp. HMSC075B03]|uniref:hypothetical protein n=1 Tax=Anaerococcus sp. HMSC075B03 TaxID=1739537 RepID=UPI0008A2BA52|nr:hypothetical protein [Anaerococcus sp. HMSC075B03]OFO43541.1 hypothetical protein HMPREF3045_07690 [Anaerococcus sp. HMSC075B03]
MKKFIDFELYKQRKNKFYYLFFLIILISHIVKANQFIHTDMNWMSFPLVSVPDTVLFLVLFVIYISSDLTAIEYEKGLIKLSIMVNGDRKNLIKAKIFTIIMWLIALVIFDIISSFLVGKIMLNDGTVLISDEKAILFGGVKLEGIRAFINVLFSEISIILPLICLAMFIVYAGLFLKNASIVMGIGFLYYILSLIGPEKLKYLFLVRHVYKIPSLLIKGEFGIELSLYIAISLIGILILYFVNISYFKRVEILK